MKKILRVSLLFFCISYAFVLGDGLLVYESNAKAPSFSLASSSEECRKIMELQNYVCLADGTGIGAWGTKSPFPSQFFNSVAALGLGQPYGSQIWKKGNTSIKLHFSGNQNSEKREPVLFWVEYDYSAK